MIDFSLTEEQKALQEMAREFSEKELKPNAAKYDKGDEFPEEIMKKAFQVGFRSEESLFPGHAEVILLYHLALY